MKVQILNQSRKFKAYTTLFTSLIRTEVLAIHLFTLGTGDYPRDTPTAIDTLSARIILEITPFKISCSIIQTRNNL